MYRSDVALREAISNLVIFSWNHKCKCTVWDDGQNKLFMILYVTGTGTDMLLVSLILPVLETYVYTRITSIFWVNSHGKIELQIHVSDLE
jgi:hypothetical protein